MRAALKEWAVVVDALGTGAQILILRKGGIQEAIEGFKWDHSEFWLFSTAFHQQRTLVIPSAQERFDQLKLAKADDASIKIEYFAHVVDCWHLESLEAAARLGGQHVWRDEVIAQRFDWGGEKAICAVALRVFRLAVPLNLPALSKYGGCKSWLELEVDVPTASASPVLSDAAFDRKLAQFRAALDAEQARRLEEDANHAAPCQVRG